LQHHRGVIISIHVLLAQFMDRKAIALRNQNWLINQFEVNRKK